MKYTEYPKFERGEVVALYDALPRGERAVIEEFVKYVSITSSNRVRLENNRRSLTHFRTIVGKDFYRIRLEDLRAYLTLLNYSHHSTASRNELKATIKRFLKWKFKDWSSRFDELRDLKLISRRNESKINASIILKKEEVERIVRSENRIVWKAFFLSLYETGFRPKEIRTLKWSNITFNVRRNVSRIHIFATKTSRARSAFVKGATHFLQEHRKMQRDNPNGLVFPAARDSSKPVGKDVVSKWLRALTLKAIGRSITPYVVRHSRATELYLNPNVPDKIAQKILGHSFSMSDVYTHLSDDDVLDICCDTVYQFEVVTPEKKDALVERIHQLEMQADDLNRELLVLKEMNTKILGLAQKGVINLARMKSHAA